MGSLFSKEKQPKQSSYNNSRIHQNTHQPPARVSHHINNNVSRVESHAPSSTIKNINKTTIDYERKWADQRYQMMAHTHKHVLKPPSTQQAPRNIQRQSTITYHSTNIQQQSNNTRQILYKQFQTSQLALKKMPIKLPTWQPMINNRQDKNVKVQNLSRYSQTYSQHYSSANINRMQSSLKSKAINDLSQTPSRNFRQIDHIRSHSVLPSSIKPVATVVKTKQSHRYGYQNGQIDHNIEQYQEIDFREEKCIFNEFLLNQMLSFKHNRSKVLLTSFNSISQYENIMISLLKQQISSGINQKIQEKKDLRQKDCLKIYLQPRNSRSKFSQKTTGIEIRTRGEDKEELQSLLLMGPCLCAITKSFPFRKGKLMSNEDSTYLCLISNFPPNEQIIAEGLERVVEKHKRSRSLYRKNNQKQEQQLAENEFYLIDITSISSYQKQYIATLRVSQSPLVPVILNNKTMPEPQGEILQRKRSLDITNSKVYYQIVQKRNVSQVAAIKGTFQHSAGIFLIQGPPGTGKTQSITNLISLQYDRNIKNRKNMKILVCAQSNAAVDHIARKIRQNGLIGIQRRPYILKFGCIDQVSEDGLQINLNHICETRVLGTVNKKNQWSASLRTQLENLKNDLKKSRLSNQPSNKIKEIKKKLSQAQKQLTKIRKQLAQKRPEYTRIQMEEISKCEICFSTLNTSGSISTLKGIINKISCLIIDEASQATQPSTLIPLLTNVKKMILVGDHKQLQPTVMSSLANHTMYNRSIFERMTDLGVQPYLLNVQYRMHPELSKFSSDFFYQGRVTDGECKDKTPESLQNLQSRALFIDLKTVKEEQYKKSKINKLEAQCIMSLIKILVKLDNNLQIGVIAPYKAQINLLEQRVAEEFKNRKASVRVSTVDAFQGQQVDVVIFSCTRANKQNKIGFVSDPKRLNVAITRAKHALFVFGNGSTFKKDHTWKAYLEHHLDSATIKIVHEIVNCRQLLIDHIIGEK